MSDVAEIETPSEIQTSCGTLVTNNKRQLLLCRATNMGHWDIPKGRMDPGELPLEAAMREMREETGLVFDANLFEEIGNFEYRWDKRLHLFRLRAPETLVTLDHLVCTSHFYHPVTKAPTPEMDAYRWAAREEIQILCTPRMCAQLLSLDW